MKVTETHDIDDDKYGTLSVDIVTDEGNAGVTFMAQEPEDATFGRDLNGAYSIANLLGMAYEAGVNGEPFEYEFIDENETEVDK